MQFPSGRVGCKICYMAKENTLDVWKCEEKKNAYTQRERERQKKNVCIMCIFISGTTHAFAFPIRSTANDKNRKERITAEFTIKLFPTLLPFFTNFTACFSK